MVRGVVFTVPRAAALALDAGVWFVWSALVGYSFHRLPVARFAADSRLTRLRRFERDGRWYERALRVKRWKRLLPEAGALFTGGFSKRSVATRDRAVLERYVAETRRAELVHWAVFAIWPVFALWNPWWAVAVMLGYAVAANAPCLVVQRYNRARVLRVLERARSRSRVS